MVQRPKSIFCLVFIVLLTWPQKHKQYFVWPFFLTQAEKPNHVWSSPPDPKTSVLFGLFFFLPDPSTKTKINTLFGLSILQTQAPKWVSNTYYGNKGIRPQSCNIKPRDYRSWWSEWSTHLARWTGNRSCAVARTQTPAAWLGPPNQSKQILLHSCIFIITTDTL